MRSCAMVLCLAGVTALVGCSRQQAATQAPAAVAAAPAATFTVPELPDYPGSTRTKLETKAKEGYSHVVEATFLASDPLDAVTGFYEQAIPTIGWQVTSSKVEADEAKWKLAKGTSTAEIEVERSRDGGVKITLERRDRQLDFPRYFLEDEAPAGGSRSGSGALSPWLSRAAVTTCLPRGLTKPLTVYSVYIQWERMPCS